MSRVRVPQEQLGTGPLSVLSTPLPPINTPTVAGQLAGILSGGADVATRAVGFMAATQQMKNQEAILSIRNNEAAVREAEQSARQLEADEARNASIMRGEAGLAFDEVSGSIQEAFASGQMDAHIGRVPDAEALAAIADGFADPATAGFGADSEYTKQFKREARALVTRLGLSRQVQLQEIDKQSNITATQRDLATATTPEQVVAVRDQTKDTLGLTDAQWVEQVLTPALQGRAAAGDTSIVPLANQFIDDTRIRAALSNQAENTLEALKSSERMNALNDLSIRSQNAGNDIGAITATMKDIRALQESTPEARATLDAMYGSLQSRIENITNSAIRAGVEQKEAEFKQGAAASHMAALTSAVESGQGYTMLDGAEQTSIITYTKADGTTETKEVKYTSTQADAERAMLAVIDQKARAVAGDDKVLYRRTRLNEVRKNAMVDPDLSSIASAGISKLSEYTAQEGAEFPPESIEGFSVYLDSLDIAPNAIRLGASEANVYAVAAQALGSQIVGGNPQDVETKARALSFAIRSIKRPDAGKLSEKMAAQFASAARDVTAEWFDVNRDEEGRVADVAQFIKDRATFYYVTGDPLRMTPEKAIGAAKQEASKYGRSVNGHWTMTYTEMPVAGNGKPLDENMDLLAEAMARDYGIYNPVDETWWPGQSNMGKADVKFTQLPSGRWVVTDSRNPFSTSIVTNRNGDRMKELSTTELVSRVNAMVNDRIIRDNAGVVEARTSTNPTLRAMAEAPAGALGDTYRLPFQTNQ